MPDRSLNGARTWQGQHAILMRSHAMTTLREHLALDGERIMGVELATLEKEWSAYVKEHAGG